MTPVIFRASPTNMVVSSRHEINVVRNDENASIAGPLMAQYLLSMLASRSPGGIRGDPFGGLGVNFGEGAESGRWGDYVFNQEGERAFNICDVV